MADVTGAIFSGISEQGGITANRLLLGVGVTASTARAVPNQTFDLTHVPTPYIVNTHDATSDSLIAYIPSTDYTNTLGLSPGLFWFERMHSFPESIELGNILTTVVRDIEIYSSYRETTQTLDTAVNNAGTGITFQNLPTLPANIPQNDGLIFQVAISTQGQPTIDGTLDFTTSILPLSIPITGTRVVMMSWEPHGLIQEKLEFLTDIIRSANGKEQRIRVRNYPRQVLDYSYMIEEGEERRKLEAFLYKWHPQVFGVPIWFESQRTTTAISAGATFIPFPNNYSDFRVGSLLIIWTDYQTFDALEIANIFSGIIEVTSPTTRDYPARTKVMPLRTGVTKQEISGDKYAVNLATLAIKFYITDNEVDIGNTSAFNTHNGKVMFDDPNWISRETSTDTLKNLIHIIDNKVGSRTQFTDWENSHIITTKGFFCRNPKALWEMRQVLHALAGRQKSFYLPTFYFDVIPTNDLVSGNNVLDIENIGYVDFINGNEPNKSLRIELNDGTIITRQVLSSSVIDATTERLIVDINWSANVLVSDIKKISFLRLGRFSNDVFNINHNNSGQATLRATVQGVIQ